MTQKRVIVLAVLILLVPVEILLLVMVCPIFLIGGFGTSALAVWILHLGAFAYCNVRMDKTSEKLSGPFIAVFVVGAIAVSLASIEYIYPQIPEDLWERVTWW